MAKSKLPVPVFITSDHGERVGDNGLFGHSVVEMPIAQVPFMYFSNDPAYAMKNISPQIPLNHYQVATLINKMLGYDISNPNQKMTPSSSRAVISAACRSALPTT